MPSRLPGPSRFRFVLHLILLGLAVPCVYFGGAGLAFSYRERAANAAYISLRLPQASAPTRKTRLMVFAPHCDDETLGCGGLIQQTLTAGGQAQVVLLTNGDGFRTAVECATHSMQVTPNDYIRFAALRQQESCHALAGLGLKPDAVHFLGYPDQGLLALWNDHWTSDRPFRSTFTRCDRSPYPNTYHNSAPYCGRSLLDDIEATMRAFHPTLITVTHPAEDHPDHAAAAAFVAYALQELQADPLQAGWAKYTRLEYYLVHRGDWPLPQGAYPAAPLAPPAAMAHVDTHWTTLHLTPPQTAQKARSIERYASQTAMMGRFLRSFARSTEILGEIAPARLAAVPAGSISLDADQHSWEHLPPVLLDPVRDDILRDLNAGGDVRALYACRDQDTLYVRLDCRGPISSRFRYRLTLRAFDPMGRTDAQADQFRLDLTAPSNLNHGIRVHARGSVLEAAIPWTEIEADCDGGPVRTLAISVETALPGVTIDKTGVRFLTVVSDQWSVISGQWSDETVTSGQWSVVRRIGLFCSLLTAH